MKTWTTQAELRLNEYLRERAARERLDWEEAAELKEDLRRHVFEEAENHASEKIGLMHLEQILSGMDAGYRGPHSEPPENPKSSRRPVWVWIFAVILPALVLLIEATTSFCAASIFNPIPTWWHFLLVALVPVSNAWLLKGAPGGREEWKGAASGSALIVSGFYALLFLPIVHISLIAIIFIGMGFLSLSPILAWIASWRIGRRLKKESPSPGKFRLGRWAGMAVAVAAIFALEASSAWTRFNLAAAMEEEGGTGPALARLRMVSSEKTLLKACYESGRGMWTGTDIVGWMGIGWSIPAEMFGLDGMALPRDPVKARELFFRVTGKSFNSVKPPETATVGLSRRSDPLEEFEFDEGLGGDEVAVRLKSLDLKESRFDGHVDSVSRIGYGEWTMIFQNRSRDAKEARCQVKLPAGGRVSRLTLWVNGEPREAAFSSVAKVKAAYKEVAVVQRRDPVLVTMVGPDTVLVQCFPVPAQGEMKFRFGITAPILGRDWELPRILERNFGMKKGLEHAVWLQADKGFELSGVKKPLVATQDGDGKSLAVSLPAGTTMGEGVSLVIEPLPAEPAVVWCEDRFAGDGEKILVREPRKLKVDGVGKIVLVIDGSLALADFKKQLVAAMGDGVIGILADDSSRKINGKGLGSYRFSGGRDNEPALREGIRISKENGGCPIVWVHGAQAVAVSQTEALLQLLERGTVQPAIYEVQAGSGPNRLAEAIYRLGVLKRGPVITQSAAGFSEFMRGLREGREESGWTWRRSAAGQLPEGVKVWDQLARLWAVGASEDPRQAVPEAERPALAARYQLVTPVSGAVVLETQEQYAKHGLMPVDGSAAPHIPGVPEPSTGLLVILSATALILRRNRRLEDQTI